MPKIKVYVQLKSTVLDAQGQVVRNALHSLGYENLDRVRMGKYIELTIHANGRPIEEEVAEMCERLLANPVMEEYVFEIAPEDGTESGESA